MDYDSLPASFNLTNDAYSLDPAEYGPLAPSINVVPAGLSSSDIFNYQHSVANVGSGTLKLLWTSEFTNYVTHQFVFVLYLYRYLLIHGGSVSCKATRAFDWTRADGGLYLPGWTMRTISNSQYASTPTDCTVTRG